MAHDQLINWRAEELNRKWEIREGNIEAKEPLKKQGGRIVVDNGLNEGICDDVVVGEEVVLLNDLPELNDEIRIDLMDDEPCVSG